MREDISYYVTYGLGVLIYISLFLIGVFPIIEARKLDLRLLNGPNLGYLVVFILINLMLIDAYFSRRRYSKKK